MQNPLSLAFLLCVFGIVGACSTPAIEEDEPTTEFAPAKLYPVKSSGFARAFVARDAQLSTYAVVDIPPLDVSDIDIPQTLVMGTTKSDWLMTPEREKALQQAWAAAMDQAFAAYSQADKGAGVLRITAKMTRMAPGRPTATTVGVDLQPNMSRDVVEVSMEFRLYKQDSGDLLGVIRDNRTMTSAAMSRTSSIGMELLFRSWAALLHTRISGK